VSTSTPLPLLYRDLIVVDDSWTEEAWSAAMEPLAATASAASGVSSGSVSNGTSVNLKHPASRHVVSKYSTFMFNNSQYHFNSVGEFSLNISAGHFHSGANLGSNKSAAAPATGTHTAILWPDRIIVRGLSDGDIPAIVKAALSTEPFTRDIAERKIAAPARVVPFPQLVVVSACSGSPGFSIYRAKQTLDWFRNAAVDAAAASGEKKIKAEPVLVLADDLKNHRSGTNVLILPAESDQHGCGPNEDAFELQLALSKERIRNLFSKY